MNIINLKSNSAFSLGYSIVDRIPLTDSNKMVISSLKLRNPIGLTPDGRLAFKDTLEYSLVKSKIKM